MMKVNDKCLLCVVNQAIKVANMTKVADKEALLREVFLYLSKADFKTSTPEMIGEIFEMIKGYTNPDPYKETRKYYNSLFLKLLPELEEKITRSENPFLLAIRYAIVGNIIDFNPIHNTLLEDIYHYLDNTQQMELAIDHSKELMEEVVSAKCLLYLGDNCGEICLDKLLLQQIKKINPDINLIFAVRGKPVVNDSIEEDAYFVGIDHYAQIIDNGDSSIGTVLKRTSQEFREVYENADLVISKGQANYECLSEEKKKIFFLLVTKCEVNANDIGVEEKRMICMRK